ncbi:quinon protein alcohol dehydrogenase-like superfamily [Xylaria cubensis]|nr:quinon protein alcohol dehydrogenase-like superfamily [Xylaria cubensis]
MEAGFQSTEPTPAVGSLIRQLSREDYTVGWICALSTEHIAAIAFLDENYGHPAIQDPNDHNSYTLGRYGTHNTVIAVLPSGEYGKSSAASVARDMLRSFPNIRIGLMVGIGGGAPNRNNDVRLGDVVVSTPTNGKGGVMQYDMGKDIQDKGFQISGYLDQPPRVLRTAVQDLQTEYTIDGHQLEQSIRMVLQGKPRIRKKYTRPSDDSDKLYRSNVLHNKRLCCEAAANHDPSILVKRPQREAEDSLVVHYGLIASGDTLIKNAFVRDRLSRDEGVLCFEMEAAGLMNHFPCLVVRGICDYSDTHKNKQWQNYAAMTATAYAKDLLRRMPTRGVHNEQTIVDHLRQLGQDLEVIDRKIVNIDERLVRVNENTINIDNKMILNFLPIAHGATFDSHNEEYNKLCLPDTRVELLQTIYQWVDDQEREAVFWLNGMAGTGKSTISRTLSRAFSESRQLGASFFFKRGEADRSVAAKLFTTIAAQLSRTVPGIAHCIKPVLDDDPSIVQKSLREQFQRLILEPLSNTFVNSQQQKTLLIVVDALDECVMENDIIELIRIFSLARKQAPRLRIFVTSRPELPLRMGFDDLSGKYEKFMLHEIRHSVIRKDIYTFLKHELSVSKAEYNKFIKDDLRCLPSDWPTESNLEELLNMTVPLFISAATICRFLFDYRLSGSPVRKLCVLLEQTVSSPHSSKMNIYQSVLAQMLRDLTEQEKEKAVMEFRIIVGPIVVLATPLSASALARMLNIEEDIIHHRLDHLHSVLSVPRSVEEPIKLFHLSFRDFLLDFENRERPGFCIDERETHRQLRTNCIRVMEGSLKKDMCDLKWPGSVCPYSERVNGCLRPEVRYACQYWIHHTEQAGDFPQNNSEIYGFLNIHLLHWLEAMVLIGRIDEALMSLRLLRSRLQKGQCLELSAFLDDVLRFMLTNMHIMRTAPLQIYSSALVFAPAESIVRLTFQNDIPKYITQLPLTEPRWNACLHTLEGHNSWVFDVAFSSDGTLIASVSLDRTIRIFSTNTGAPKQVIIQQPYLKSVSIALSPDGTRLVSVSENNKIQLWSVDTGALEQTENAVVNLSCLKPLTMFSPNGKYVVLCGRYEIVLWSMDTGKLQHSTILPNITAEAVTFSANSQLIVTVSKGGLVSSWSVDAGTREKTMQLPFDPRIEEEVLAISPDATLVATHRQHEAIRVWSADTGKLLHTLYNKLSKHCVFSPDSKLLATGIIHSLRIYLWSVKTGALQQTLTHISAYLSLVFSPDSTLLASGYDDGKIRLWSVHQTMEGDNSEHPLQASVIGSNHTPTRFLTFSPDGSFLILENFERGAVLLWNTTKGSLELLSRHRGPQPGISISPDSQFIAILNWDFTFSRVSLFSATTGSLLQSVRGYRIAFSPDSKVIAIVKERYVKKRHTIQLWSNTGSLERTIEGQGLAHSLLRRLKDRNALKLLQEIHTKHDSEIASITFSCDSQLVASLSNRSAQIWSISGNLQKDIDVHQTLGAAKAFSPDLRLIAISNRSDNELLLMSTTNLRLHRRLSGLSQFESTRANKSNAIAFSADSSLVAVAWNINEIYVWSISTAQCLQTLDIKPFRVSRLSFDKRNQFLLSNIGTLRLLGEQLPNSMNESTSVTSDSTLDQLPVRGSLWHDYRELCFSYGLSTDKCWITSNGENLLWLPPDFRPEIFDVSGSHIAISTEAGTLVIIGFSDSLLSIVLESSGKPSRHVPES